jgi:hypothetical protein
MIEQPLPNENSSPMEVDERVDEHIDDEGNKENIHEHLQVSEDQADSLSLPSVSTASPILSRSESQEHPFENTQSLEEKVSDSNLFKKTLNSLASLDFRNDSCHRS